MKRVAMLGIASVFAATAAAAQNADRPSSPAAAPAEAQVASVAIAQALVWRQWMALAALSSLANDPNAKPEDVEAARKRWLTNGADVLTVPSTGPAAQWFTRGADVMSTQAGAADATTPGLDAAPAQTFDASELADASTADEGVDAGVEDSGEADASSTEASSTEPDASIEAFGGGPTQSNTLATKQGAPQAAPPIVVNAVQERRPTRDAHVEARDDSRGWLVLPATAAMGSFVAMLLVARRRRRLRAELV